MTTIQDLIDNHIITSRTPDNMAQYEIDQIRKSLMGEPRDPDRKYAFEVDENELATLKRFGFEGLFNLGKNYLSVQEMTIIITAFDDTQDLIDRIHKTRKEYLISCLKLNPKKISIYPKTI